MTENETNIEQPVAQPENQEAVTPAIESKSESPVNTESRNQAKAFYEMRKQNKALKDELKAIREQVSSKEPVNEEVTPKVPEPKVNIADLITKADDEMLSDPEILKTPSAVFQVMDLLDSDSYLNRMNAVDPVLARKMALKKWKEETVQVAQPISPTSNVSRGSTFNMEAAVNQLDSLKPGTKEYKDQLNKILKNR